MSLFENIKMKLNCISEHQLESVAKDLMIPSPPIHFYPAKASMKVRSYAVVRIDQHKGPVNFKLITNLVDRFEG